jgi:thiamine-phosphate pyrophosphorylase
VTTDVSQASSDSRTHRRERRIAGLYAVTPDLADTRSLVGLVEAAIAGGATTVQYRNKIAGPALRMEQASLLARLCAAHDVPLIVNDHVELAMALPAAGLHVGADDCDGPATLRALRARLGQRRILGVSCYRSIDLAREAVAAGADYVAFGSVFASATKPHAPPAPLDLFEQAGDLGVARIGIGGITRDNIAALIAAGADAAAVIGELFASGDPAVVARQAGAMRRAFDRSP